MSVVSLQSNARRRPVLQGVCLLALLLGAATSPRAHAAEVPVSVPVTTLSRATTAPLITLQPQSAVVNAGKPATFTVAARSATTVAYQWMRNGAQIAGATADTYVVPATSLSDSGASFTVMAKNAGGSTSSGAARLTVNALLATEATAARPFSDQSPWNARPTKFTLGSTGIPAGLYFPLIAEGTYSLGVFAASASDPAVTVRGNSASGLWVPDTESVLPSITIPHWPAGVVPAVGDDGHADIVDASTNSIHSFWQLKSVNGQWMASSYAWSPLNGRGFGTPGQYVQGARAAGVPSMAGLIRKSEVNDGLPAYKHALTMSLAYNGLASKPSYVFPATSSDADAATANSGQIPEGALMMIPASFDVTQIKDARLLKIVRTLQSFGAYVTDRNYGTPFALFVENGSNFELMPNGWDNEIASELQIMRAAMRQVVSTTEWVDANGAVFTPDTNLNLLSMRGPFVVQRGTTAGTFDTMQQAVVFANNGVATQQVNWSGRSMPAVTSAPMAGKSYTLKVVASGNATLKFDLYSGSRVLYSSGALADGASVTFAWPADGLLPVVTTFSGPQGGGKVSATLTAVAQ